MSKKLTAKYQRFCHLPARPPKLQACWLRHLFTKHLDIPAYLLISLLPRGGFVDPVVQGGLNHLRQIAYPQNGSTADFLPKHMRGSGPQVIPGAPQESAPALEPTLALYKELYRRGFSVTFITGR